MYECVVAEVRMPRQTKGCVCMNVGFWKWEGQGGMARRTLDSDDPSVIGVALSLLRAVKRNNVFWDFFVSVACACRLDVETSLDLPVIICLHLCINL